MRKHFLFSLDGILLLLGTAATEGVAEGLVAKTVSRGRTGLTVSLPRSMLAWPDVSSTHASNARKFSPPLFCAAYLHETTLPLPKPRILTSKKLTSSCLLAALSTCLYWRLNGNRTHPPKPFSRHRQIENYLAVTFRMALSPLTERCWYGVSCKPMAGIC